MCLMCSQHALSSLTMTLSMLGNVLKTLIVFFSTSLKETVCSQSRWPVLSQLLSRSRLRLLAAKKRLRIFVYKALAFSIVSFTIVLLTSRRGALSVEESLCQPMTLYSDLLLLTLLITCLQYSCLALQTMLRSSLVSKGVLLSKLFCCTIRQSL